MIHSLQLDRGVMCAGFIIIKQVLEQLMLIQRFRKFMPSLFCQHKAYWLAQLREFYLQV